jgi:shikimate dehydrogenase
VEDCSVTFSIEALRGKDTPGSPVTDSALFPHHAIVWEFNYRGELDFLHQAQAQLERRDLQDEDGWMYFIQGWTMIVTRILHIELTPAL